MTDRRPPRDEGDTSFMKRGACLGMTDDAPFFPSRGESSSEAKAVCAGCAVREQCLEYALANGERWGIWGGLSEGERSRLRRARRAAGEVAARHVARAIPHGTEPGWRRCVKRPEGSCAGCREAHAIYVEHLPSTPVGRRGARAS